MYKLTFYVPKSHLESVKTALFNKGAGRMGQYDCVCWQVQGLGQYRPLPGSQPFHGEQGKLETLPEWKVEMVCEDALIEDVLTELKRVHPYEEPAFAVLKLIDF